jgi:hypothetical protein
VRSRQQQRRCSAAPAPPRARPAFAVGFVFRQARPAAAATRAPLSARAARAPRGRKRLAWKRRPQRYVAPPRSCMLCASLCIPSFATWPFFRRPSDVTLCRAPHRREPAASSPGLAARVGVQGFAGCRYQAVRSHMLLFLTPSFSTHKRARMNTLAGATRPSRPRICHQLLMLHWAQRGAVEWPPRSRAGRSESGGWVVQPRQGGWGWKGDGSCLGHICMTDRVDGAGPREVVARLCRVPQGGGWAWRSLPQGAECRAARG